MGDVNVAIARALDATGFFWSADKSDVEYFTDELKRQGYEITALRTQAPASNEVREEVADENDPCNPNRRIAIERATGKDGDTDFVLSGLDDTQGAWVEVSNTGITLKISKDGRGVSVRAFNTGREDEAEIDEMFATGDS